MSIKTTLGQIHAMVEGQVFHVLNDLVPPGAQLFRIARLLTFVDQEYAECRKQHVAIFQKFGRPELDADGKPTGKLTVAGIDPEAARDFATALHSLFATEVTITADPIDWSKLGEAAQAKLTLANVRALGPFIVEGGEAPAPALKSVP